VLAGVEAGAGADDSVDEEDDDDEDEELSLDEDEEPDVLLFSLLSPDDVELFDELDRLSVL